MILHQHQWQGHYGALRRKNDDTPPLEGCRKSRKWISVVIRFRVNSLGRIGSQLKSQGSQLISAPLE